MVLWLTRPSPWGVGRATQIVEDQRLRELGEGETALTNPNLYVRRRFRKLYEDYKPQFSYWKLVLMTRKLALACVAILLSKNAHMQVAYGGAFLSLLS